MSSLNCSSISEILEKVWYGLSCVSVHELFAGLDEEHIETTIQSAALDETEYENIKQDVIKICDRIS